MSEVNEAQTVAGLAEKALEPKTLEPGEVYLVPDGDGRVKVLDTDAYADAPRNKVANRVINDVESFVAYIAKHNVKGSTELYADAKSGDVIAVFDSHHEGAIAGWQKHKATLKLEFTRSWLAWTQHDTHWFKQIEFAEFIEQHTVDVVKPSAGDLMSLAQKFYMTKGVEYESSERLADGETTLVYKEKVESRGLGNIEVPKELELVLQPYVNGPRQFAFAQFRTKLDGSVLYIGYVLIRPDEILEGVFADTVNILRNGRPANAEAGHAELAPVDAPIYTGRP